MKIMIKKPADHPECFSKHLYAKKNVSKDSERLVGLAFNRNLFLRWSRSLDTPHKVRHSG